MNISLSFQKGWLSKIYVFGLYLRHFGTVGSDNFFLFDSKKFIVFIFAYRLLGTPHPHTLYFLVEAKSRVREVYTQTCLHFAKQGMLDTELFGLAVLMGELNTFHLLFN